MRRFDDLTIEVIGKRLKESRKTKGQSQKNVAEHLGVDVGTVSRYESGTIEIPVTKLIKFGEICDYEPKNYLRREYEGVEEFYDLLSDGTGIPESVKGWAENSVDLTTLPDQNAVELSEDVVRLVKAYKTLSEIPSIDPTLVSQMRYEVLFHFELNGFLTTETERKRMKKRLLAYMKLLKRSNNG